MAVKRSEALLHAITWVNPENTVLNGRSHSQRTNIARPHFYEMSRTSKSIETESSLVASKGWKVQREWLLTGNAMGIYFRGD